jgi:hypothetical protein
MGEEKLMEVAIAEMQKDILFINKNLEKIDGGIIEMKNVLSQQTALQNEVARAIEGHSKLTIDMSGIGTRVSACEGQIEDVGRRLNDLPKSIKVNVFDYVWKYIALAIGGWIALKTTGVLP